LLLAVNIDINVAVFSNIRDPWIRPFMVFVNSLISIVVIIFYVKFVIKLISKSAMIEIENSFKALSV
jgi:putative exporter of polyketide antibiotics